MKQTAAEATCLTKGSGGWGQCWEWACAGVAWGAFALNNQKSQTMKFKRHSKNIPKVQYPDFTELDIMYISIKQTYLKNNLIWNIFLDKLVILN